MVTNCLEALNPGGINGFHFEWYIYNYKQLPEKFVDIQHCQLSFSSMIARRKRVFKIKRYPDGAVVH